MTMPGPDDVGPTGDEYRWLPTMPGTYLEFSSAGPGKRGRPCWRCRLWLRWPPWRRHWQCRKLPPLEYVDSRLNIPGHYP